MEELDELSFDNIFSGDEFDGYFGQSQEENNEETPEEKNDKENPEEEKENKDTIEEKGEKSSNPESVDGDENKASEEDTSPKGVENSSPDFYSSIAKALAGDGVLKDVKDEDIKEITSAEDFADLIDKQVQNQLTERQRRIDEALRYGVETDDIKKYENIIENLDNITEEALSGEDEKSENLRKNLIYQDYINRGFSKERATREVNRSFDAGTDIDDAKEAIQSNKEYFTAQYNSLIKEAKKEAEEAKKKYKKQAEELKDSIVNGEKAFGEVEVDKKTRQKVYDSIMKPVYTDPDTGERLTAIQKYERENKIDFIKNVGLLYVLTDGFKKVGGLLKGQVKKEVNKNLKELESVINNTSRTSSGSLDFASGLGDESKSIDWTPAF